MDKGIIFSAPMVRALLDGRKTQTRRLLKVPGIMGGRFPILPPEEAIELEEGEFRSGTFYYSSTSALSGPYRSGYSVGDRLYVREAWHVRGEFSDIIEVGYRASERQGYTQYVEHIAVEQAVPSKGKWPVFPKYGPSIHMPRWVSRLWLNVTEVRIEPLQNISELDARSEGIYLTSSEQYRRQFRLLWDGLHTEEGTSWLDNPWVVALTFEVHQGNIDGGAA